MMTMKTVLLIVAAFLLMAASASASCRQYGSVWESDSDGSVRLTIYDNRDRVELIQRAEDNLLIARGLTVAEGYLREVYVLYDLKTGNLVHGVSEFNADPPQMKGLVPIQYSMQPNFIITVFTADKNRQAEIKALVDRNAQSGCHDELVKLVQGRTFDQQKCGDSKKQLDKLLSALIKPEQNGFNDLSGNSTVQRYITKRRAKLDCTTIEKMETKVIEWLQKSSTQTDINKSVQMPEYLEGGKGVFEQKTIERYRY